MNYSPEIIADIEQYAKLPGVTLLQIATAIGVDYSVFLADSETYQPVKDAINRGSLTWEVTFKKQLNKLSDQGSGPAQTLILKIKNEQKFQELLNHYGKVRPTAVD